MKNILMVAALFALVLPIAAQQMQTWADINSQVKIIDNNKAIKTYESSYQVHDKANVSKTYSYQYIADSVTGNLIKAVIKDDRYNVTRSYYFVNERLIKLYEEKLDQNGMASTHSSYFRDNSYSIANTGQSEMYDNNGTLHSGDEETLTKDIVNTSFVQSQPRRKSALEDAYIIFVNFKKLKNKN